MLADLIATAFTDNGMEAHAPDVGVGAHAADPHYSIAGEGAEIGRDQVLLLDLATKLRDVDGAPYGDTTWMTFTGPEPPADLLHTFALVRAARDAAIDAINAATAANRTMRGQEVDRIARSVIADAGMADHLIHRTGHSLGTDHVHGMGTNLDDIEFPDDRSLLRESGFTVEPGLYFPGRFGVRLEVSAILHADGVEVTTERQVEMSLFA
jgi:Xaa-Pro aminopeptidase